MLPMTLPMRHNVMHTSNYNIITLSSNACTSIPSLNEQLVFFVDNTIYLLFIADSFEAHTNYCQYGYYYSIQYCNHKESIDGTFE